MLPASTTTMRTTTTTTTTRGTSLSLYVRSVYVKGFSNPRKNWLVSPVFKSPKCGDVWISFNMISVWAVALILLRRKCTEGLRRGRGMVKGGAGFIYWVIKIFTLHTCGRCSINQAKGIIMMRMKVEVRMGNGRREKVVKFKYQQLEQKKRQGWKRVQKKYIRIQMSIEKSKQAQRKINLISLM